MKKILSIIFIILIVFNIKYTYSEDKSPYSLKSNYPLYKERVKNICEQYKPKKLIIKINDDYQEINFNDKEEEFENDYSFNKIKKTHRENMNNIYKCSILISQEKALKLIKTDLIKKNPNLMQKVGKKIDTRMNKIRLSLSALKCIKTDEKDSIIKLRVLQQTTYQTCKYISYLEYLRDYTEIIETYLDKNKKNYSVLDIFKRKKDKVLEIDEEIEHTYKVFPMAFHAYTEYENNVAIHYLLELIRDDYIVVRDKLHEVLNPINQVVYKVNNAMRK